MQAFLRTSIRSTRARPFSPRVFTATPPQRFAHESYGNKMSGHPESDAKNPKEHLEHPGPESPADKGTATSSSSGSNSSTRSSGGSESSSSGARPKINSPKSEAEDTDPEVKKHNEEMRQRSDRSANQLSESDNAVDKNFWKGDVGDKQVKS